MIGQKVLFLFPDLRPGLDFVFDDTQITQWNNNETQPSAQTLSDLDSNPIFLQFLANFNIRRQRHQATRLLQSNQPSAKLIKGIMAVMLSEINTLRANAGLPARTANQLRNALNNWLDNN